MLQRKDACKCTSMKGTKTGNYQMALWGTGIFNNYHAELWGFVGFGMFWAVRLEAGSGLTLRDMWRWRLGRITVGLEVPGIWEP